MNEDSGQEQQKENPIKSELRESLRERIIKYRMEEADIKDFLEKNPDVPKKTIEENTIVILAKIENLREILEEITPYILKIRQYTPNLLDQNRFSAVYFLFGKISQSWRALFLLAKEGFHYEVMEILRSIIEASDLAFLFAKGDDSSTDLKKWFDGEIVGNSEVRESLGEFINEGLEESGITFSVKKLGAGIYGALSKYTHVSYAALLDSFDVYSRDFDFEKRSGFHYTAKSSLQFARGTMSQTIIGLKNFYMTVGDNDSYKELDLILRKNFPDMYDMNKNRELIKRMNQEYS